MNLQEAKQYCEDLQRGTRDRLITDEDVEIEGEIEHETWEKVAYIYSKAGDEYASRTRRR